MRQIDFRALPPALRVVAEVFKESIEIYECDNMNEVVKVDNENHNNLEMTVINQMDKTGNNVERHYFIGCALDVDPYKPASERKPPQLYFAPMNDKQFDAYKNMINERLHNKKKSNLII